MSKASYYERPPDDVVPVRSGLINCTAGQETSLGVGARFHTGLKYKLKHLAVQSEAGAEGYIEFRQYLDGILVGGSQWKRITAQQGVIGVPDDVPNEADLCGIVPEWRVYNSHGSTAFQCSVDARYFGYRHD